MGISSLRQHTMIDPTAVTALVVSCVALVVTLLQAAQQYAATAYDYRHCSSKSVGGWARNSTRRFIWKELRYDVTFTTPIISLRVRTVPIALATKKHKRSDTPTQYHLMESNMGYNASDKPWFLNADEAKDEAKCSWLSLLEATSVTDLDVRIKQRPGSYDYMPDGISKSIGSI